MPVAARRSLSKRLFVSAVLVTVPILAAAGFGLSTLNRRNAENGFDERLHVYIQTIVGGLASQQEFRLPDGENFGDPRFDLPLSGWYWQVARLGGEKPDVVASSQSLVGETLPAVADPRDRIVMFTRRRAYVRGPDERRLRIVEREVELPEEGRFRVSVAGPADELTDAIRRFDLTLLVTFALLAAALLGTTLFQVIFGLHPLKRLGAAVAGVRRGEAERVSGDYPTELAPLAQEINLLLDSNREILERARTQVGNLAHALKTPLSVIVNEADASPESAFSSKVREQAGVMRDQVAFYLERARAAARAGSQGVVTPLEPVVAALVRTFGKIYRDRDLAFEVDIAGDTRLFAEKQDVEEMIGNLLDNAGKWAARRVAISAERIEAEGGESRPRLVLRIDDDGPGLPEAARAAALARGARLDETKPGSGLGLSIVADLAGLHGGRLMLAASPLGGLRAELDLPCV